MNDCTKHHRHAWQPRQPSRIERLKPLAAAILLVILYGIVGQSDYDDAVAMDEHYAEMVCAGYWPDYEARKPNCSAIQIAATNQ